MHSKEVRQKYLNFFKSKGHSIIPSASILPENDSTTLFTSSGMQPLVPYLLGEKHPEGKRLCNSQKSFRADDIEEVGDSRHTTFFEMLGNWSLGDYFKKEQLAWIFEFLTDELNIDFHRLYVTVFRGNPEINVDRDTDSVKIWQNLFQQKSINALDIDDSEKNGMQNGRIFYYPDNKNWWSRSGPPSKMPIGEPGGPDSEIFYDLGADLKKHENSFWADKPCHVNCDCGRFIEIGNSVFMEFQRTERGFEKLKQQNVDFGGGLERITMVVQGLNNIFLTDLFINIINKIEQFSNKKYENNIKSFEIIADHLRAATFIMGDDKGVAPSNLGQGYIVRRLIRRAIRHSRLLEINKDLWTTDIAKIIINDYKEIYPELQRNINFVLTQFENEEIKFNQTVERGLKEFEKLAKEANKNIISGSEAFNLYQTFGFPIELTMELAEERGFKVDENDYKKALEEHQELSRTASAGMFKSGLADSSEKVKQLHTATHLLHQALRNILGQEVQQMGSNITSERLRFDFSCSQKLTEEEIQKVENLVNEKIKEDLNVEEKEMNYEGALKIGALAFFQEKYPEMVKVYSVGDFSKEFCAGPHVKKTSELGQFKIIKEESVSAGVRRIRAILM